MNKIGFGVLIGYVQLLINRGIHNGSYSVSVGDAQDIDALINDGMNKAEVGLVSPANLDYLLACMGTDNKKIEAIKHYRALTNVGLKEAKDAVERYWVQRDKAE